MRVLRKTKISCGAFLVPVCIYKATSDNKVPLEFASEAGNPTEQIYVDKVTGEKIEGGRDARIPGVFTEEGFKAISKETIAEIKEGTKLNKLEIQEFVELKNVPFERVDGAYFLGPNEENYHFKLLHEAMRKKKVCAVGKWTNVSRQYLVIFYPTPDGKFIMNKLDYADSWKEPDTDVLAAASQKPKPEEIKVLSSIIDNMKGKRDLIANATDDLIPLLENLYYQALKGESITIAQPAEPITIPELMQALEETYEQTKEEPVGNSHAAQA